MLTLVMKLICIVLQFSSAQIPCIYIMINQGGISIKYKTSFFKSWNRNSFPTIQYTIVVPTNRYVMIAMIPFLLLIDAELDLPLTNTNNEWLTRTKSNFR